jgi:hypothetical protein
MCNSESQALYTMVPHAHPLARPHRRTAHCQRGPLLQLVLHKVHFCAQHVHERGGVDEHAHAVVLHELIKLALLVCSQGARMAAHASCGRGRGACG